VDVKTVDGVDVEVFVEVAGGVFEGVDSATGTLVQAVSVKMIKDRVIM
jgi:hypothetical protein